MPHPDATWRVYLSEWVTVYTSDASGGLDGGQECFQRFRDKYKGRVRNEDVQVVPAVAGAPRDAYRPYCLQLNLWNLRGEFKDEADAVLMLAAHAGIEERPRVVQRGSPEEQALLDYGVKMLPATEVDGGKG